MDCSANMTHNPIDDPKRKSVQSWYAGMLDEKKAEYNQKRRTLYKEKKAAKMNTVNHEQVSQANASSLLDVHRTPLSNITNTINDGLFVNLPHTVSMAIISTVMCFISSCVVYVYVWLQPR